MIDENYSLLECQPAEKKCKDCTDDECLYYWQKRCYELEQALKEIKKLTVIGINASQCNCGLRALADDILQIIRELENESN